MKASAGGPRSHITPDPAVAEFLDCLRYERGMSGNTVTAYERDLQRYAAFLKERAVTPPAASEEDVRAYFAGTAGLRQPSEVRGVEPEVYVSAMHG